MKQISLLFATLFVTFFASAQSEKLAAAISTNLEKVNFVSSTDELQNAINKIEGICQIETDRWELAYHAAYSYMILATRTMEELDLQSQYVDKAQSWLDKVNDMTEESSETHAMQAYIYIGRIWKDPTVNAFKYSSLAIASLEKSIAFNPDNPRPYYLKGMNLFHTPVFFGGGPDNAKPIFLRAKEKFEKFEKTSELMPEWGEVANNYFLAKCGVEVD